MQAERKKEAKMSKWSMRKTSGSHLDLHNLVLNEKIPSPVQCKVLPRRSQRLSLQNRDTGVVLAGIDATDYGGGIDAADYGTKSLTSGCSLDQNISATSTSPDDVTSLLHSVSLVEKPSVCNENILNEKKEQMSNENILNEKKEQMSDKMSITFSPACSIKDDLKNDVVNIIEILAEEKNGNESPSEMSPYHNEANRESTNVKDILKGVTAYVEVRSGHENRTKAVERQLREMGAKIVPRFFSTTTHVIFKEGRKSTRDKAVARNVPLISVLWVESCRQQKKHVPEEDFPADIPAIYDSPVPCRRLRKLKSMQPKDFNTEFAGSIERLNKIFSRIRQDNKCYSASSSFCDSETSESVKDDDGASNDNANYTPLSSIVSVTAGRLFGLPQDKREADHLGNKGNSKTAPGIEDVDNSISISETNGFVIKRRKLFSRLNQSPQLKVAAPKIVKKGKSSSTPRKASRNKIRMRTSLTHLTDERRTNVQSENNQPMDSSESIEIDGQKTDVIGSSISLKKENSRSSLDDFENKKHRKTKRLKTKHFNDSCGSGVTCKIEKTAVKKPTMVLTSLQPTDKEVVYSIIVSLGGFQVKSKVTETTTHIVSSDGRRTLNVLFGLVRGCWILSSQWVYKSLEAGHWLDEEPFQLSEFLAASQASRRERVRHGPGYCQNLFGQLGNIFVSSQCNPSPSSLVELIRLAGGKVTTCFRRCELLIGPYTHSRRESTSNSHFLHLSEKWILDCISQHKVLPVDDYKI